MTLAICSAAYAVLIVLSIFTPLGKLYVFEWTFRHLYCLNWLPVVLLIFFNGLPIALAIAAGNFAGVFIGQFLGGFMEEYAVSGITSDMTEYEVFARLEVNYSWWIWVITVLIFTVGGVVYAVAKKGL